MNKNQETKEKTCVFYVSDYHFEMIALPYINKSLDENKEVIILTENDLESTIKILISRMNLKEEKNRKILELDWKNNDLDKFKKIKECVETEKEMVIFIKGKENYIKNINSNIEKWTEKRKSIEIIDCYDMEEISDKLDEIMEEYKNILKTSGEVKTTTICNK